MDERINESGRIVGIFAILGVGLGLAGYIVLDNMVSSDPQSVASSFISGLIMLQAISVMYFLGPAMAVVAGIYAGQRGLTLRGRTLVSGSGSFIGFYVMFVLAFLIMTVALPASGGGSTGNESNATSLGSNLGQMALVGIPTGAVGAFTAYFTGR